MPHKKGRRGQKKTRVRESGGKVYPHRLVACTARIADGCKGYMNANTMPADGICRPCWQKKNSRK